MRRELDISETSVYQTDLDYLVYSINSQGLIDNIEHYCTNHRIIGKGTDVNVVHSVTVCA